MTNMQVSILWNCAQPAGYPIFPEGNFTRQINWLANRRLIYKRHGRWHANRDGKRAVLYQTEGWFTIPAQAREALAASLRRRRA
jgi:hypothetical protein